MWFSPTYQYLYGNIYTHHTDRVADMPQWHISTPPSLCLVKCLEGPPKPSAKISFILSERKRFSRLFQGSLDSFPFKQIVFHVLSPRIQQKYASWLKCQFYRGCARQGWLVSVCCTTLGEISKLRLTKNFG